MTGLHTTTRSNDTSTSSASSAAYMPLRRGEADTEEEMADEHEIVKPHHRDSTPVDNGNGVQYIVRETSGVSVGDSRRCRWGPFSPPCCQIFRKPAWFLVCLACAGFVQGMVVNGFINVVISTLERRFQITSTESGTIASCYDIAAVVCLIPVTYFGGRGKRTLYLAVGMFILGVGAFVFSLPHFTSPLYDYGQGLAGDDVCVQGSNSTACNTGGESLSNYKYVFFLGQLLHGAGASPLYTLGVTYLDDNLPVRSTSLYQGIFYAFAIFGPGVGYLLGGAFLDFYTDSDRVDMSTIDITSDNPRWVGGWWMGFLIGGTVGVLISLPIFGFPISLPGSEKYQAEKEKEVYKGHTSSQTECVPLGIKHIFKSAKLQLSNPTFMFLNFAAACEGGVVSGFSTFAPKYIEFQFGLTSGYAAMLVGLVAIPAGGGGTFLGGWLVKRFNWNIPHILKFCLITQLITTGLSFIFFIRCENISFAGITSKYHEPTTDRGKYLGSVQLDSTCNSGCGCSQYDYNPVCGRDNVMYYSPCYAGCNTSYTKSQKYGNCSCVVYNFTADDVQNGETWAVKEGKCDSGCNLLPIFLPVFGLVMVGIFITSMPALTATLRCVAQDQRSFALGIQWIIARCLGSIPGPILFGKVIDLTCWVWQKSCHGEGACLYYDNQQMSYNLLGVGLAYNFLSCVFFFLSFMFYRTKHPPSNSVSMELNPPDNHLGVASCRTSTTTLATQPPTPNVEHANGEVRRPGFPDPKAEGSDVDGVKISENPKSGGDGGGVRNSSEDADRQNGNANDSINVKL